tara:strand:+ start:923 stop:1111 length:189 start_codon:yes stop_codon:yes gene_type:complete
MVMMTKAQREQKEYEKRKKRMTPAERKKEQNKRTKQFSNISRKKPANRDNQQKPSATTDLAK